MTVSGAALVLEDGRCFFGNSEGVEGVVFGELCFTTAMTGYQESITDPSYAGQILLFTSPHVGNVGTNCEDSESAKILLHGVVLRESPTLPSNYRSTACLRDFLLANKIVAISGVDTRMITAHLRDNGLCSCAIATFDDRSLFDIDDVVCRIKTSHIQNASVLKEVVTHGSMCNANGLRVTLVDYGVKDAILRHLASIGCSVMVVGHDASFDDILQNQPNGIVLSNGPGDPADIYQLTGSTIDRVVRSGIPVFGICLGHQLLALSFGCKTFKMLHGHRGSNHPVLCVSTGLVSVVTQNHGFAVLPNENVEVTHLSLLDNTVAGLRSVDFPVFSVQFHPEASPGPHDSYDLFNNFVNMMDGSL